MKQFALCVILVLIGLTLFTGCSIVDVYAKRVHNPDLSALKSFYVALNTEDSGNLNVVIRDELVKMGLKAETGPKSKIPDNVDALVTYDFHWFWDLGNYLPLLKIHLRNPKNNFPLAMGESLRSSFVRKSPEEMAKEVLESIFKTPMKPLSRRTEASGRKNT